MVRHSWLFRSVLFTAGHNARYIQKAIASVADCIVLDLEDAVPSASKPDARRLVRETLEQRDTHVRPVFVRINPFDSGLHLLDLEGVACGGLTGFVYPKCYGPEDIKAFDVMLRMKEEMLGLPADHFAIIVLMETPQAVWYSYAIATASPRVVGLLFGCEDFIADMEGRHDSEQLSLLVPRHLVAMGARAAHVVPIDTPYVQVKDDEGLVRHITRAKDLGYEGMLVMTPRQISIANEYYGPSVTELQEAQEMVRSADEAARDGRGIAVVRDQFVSPPTLKGARKVLARRDAIADFRRRVQEESDGCAERG